MKVKGLLTMIYNRIHRHKIYTTAEYWDSRADHLEDKSTSMWPNNFLNECYDKEQKDMLSRYTDKIPGKRVLDLGCGTGRLSEYFARLGYEVVGIDFSAKAVEVAAKKGFNIKYIVQSMFELKENESFDAIVSCASIVFPCQNKAQLGGLFRRMHAALKPGGIVLLLEPVHRGFLHRVLNLGIAEFKLTLENSGFSIRSVEHLHFWPGRLLLANIPWPRPVTDFGCSAGQWVLKNVFRNQVLGDYQLYYAQKNGS